MWVVCGGSLGMTEVWVGGSKVLLTSKYDYDENREH